MIKVSSTLWFLSSIMLAASKSGDKIGGVLGTITIAILAVMGYVFMVGFSENKKHLNSDNDSVGCMIAVCIIGIIVICMILTRKCS